MLKLFMIEGHWDDGMQKDFIIEETAEKAVALMCLEHGVEFEDLHDSIEVTCLCSKLSFEFASTLNPNKAKTYATLDSKKIEESMLEAREKFKGQIPEQ